MATRITLFVILNLTTYTLALPATTLGPKSNGTVIAESDGSQVYCQRSQWYDVFWFIFTNYVLHALSVRSLPGETALSSTVFKFCSLLVPYTGVRRGLCLILRASNLSSNNLQSAARANALCMVIRGPEWRPKDGQIVEGCEIKVPEEEKRKKECCTWRKTSQHRLAASSPGEKSGVSDISILDAHVSQAEDASNDAGQQGSEHGETMLSVRDLYVPPEPSSLIDKLTKVLIETHRFHNQPPTENIVDHSNVKIHGVCQLPPGYALSYIPEDVKVYSHVNQQRNLSILRLLGMNHSHEIKLASTHDIPRILFSIIQTISGGYALYKARGPQIERYGYAAFGLTVLPYMMVSIINLIGSLLTSEYETLYMVHSATMDEMKERGGLCDGVVGTLEKPDYRQSANPADETNIKLTGSTMEFMGSPGQVHCHGVGTDSSKDQLQVSEINHIPPSKEIWQIEKWRQQWRDRKKGSEPLFLSPRLHVPSQSSFTRLRPAWYQPYLNLLAILLLILALGMPYLIIGMLTGYRIGESTSTQRTFTLNWLTCGQLQGYAVSYIEAVKGKRRVMTSFIIIVLTYGSYCTMGLIAVAQEMIEFGTCEALN